jgi:signal transduction histidine kinase/DNA-binding response OmpR family regulator
VNLADALRRSPEGMSPEAERLHMFLRFSAPFGPIGTALVLGFWWAWGLQLLWVLVVACVVYWWLVFRGLRLVKENELQAAVLCYAGGTLALALGVGVLLPYAYALTTIVALLPVVIAVTYANRQTLLRVILLSTLIVGIGAFFTWFPPLYEPGELRSAILIVAHTTVVILVVQVGLSVWASHGKLGDVIDEMREANRKLRESERTLERKVAERTAELAERNRALEASERQLAEARDSAMQASQAKSAFLANMSHELRTPLNAIIGYSEMLQEEAEDDGNQSYVPDLDKILTSGRYLLSLINGVLDLSKIEAGKMDVYVETFDVADVVRGIEGTVKPLLAKNSNQLSIEGLEAAGSMHSDVTKVRQILFNLLSNATKFTEQGSVSLQVAREAAEGSDWLTFAVADTGIGMTPEQVERIFEAFAQAEESTSREYGGTGLGLSITRLFCEMLGGSIGAESQVGEGSRFVVRLPAQVQVGAPAGATPGAVEPASPGSTRVLVVDDDAAARDLLERFLVREGYAVVTAEGGVEALRLAREQPPDIITLDVLMPQMDGWAVLGELKSDPALREIPVVLLTMTDDRRLGYALGAAEFITKPVDWENLGRVLHRYEPDGMERRALVIDDDPLARDMLQRALERGGWSVHEAENGRCALEALGQARPSLILLDLMMPEMDGFEFLGRLRSQPAWAQVPVLVITAKTLTAAEHAQLNGDVGKILQKGSYTREELLAEVGALVSAAARRQPHPARGDDGQDPAG